MALGRRTDKVEDERGPHATAAPERGYVHESTTYAARNEVDAEEQVTTATPSASSLARGWIGVFAAWIGIGLAVVEVILGFRLGFLLAGANPSNGFVDFIYDISDPLTDPFPGDIHKKKRRWRHLRACVADRHARVPCVRRAADRSHPRDDEGPGTSWRPGRFEPQATP